ncbi:MAG: hypothetical protein L6Q83_03035, partial [Gammaproteobacteria bacterium]|nr:hypothetical protein [Gammaproteobacteria bacterium]
MSTARATRFFPAHPAAGRTQWRYFATMVVTLVVASFAGLLAARVEAQELLLQDIQVQTAPGNKLEL